MFERLGLIGCGLMGGSFALALKRAGLVRSVAGFSPSASTRQRALQLGVIDEAAASPAVAATGADLVLVAVPVGAIESTLAAIAEQVTASTLVMDVGSTKSDVVAAARRAMLAQLSSFVPAHPVAGKELSGIDHADAGLYAGRQVVLTPTEVTGDAQLVRARALWDALGCKVVTMTPQAHDAAFAAVSHLPHLVAFALMNAIGAQARGDEFLALAGPGFRDFTRIAASEPGMWCDILLGNREQVLLQSQQLQRALQELERLIAHADAEALRAQIANASAARAQWRMGGQPD
ncbi:MAG: prephenate dehydrogenase [Betaproteobacteria bacterium]|nr:prephenate dehydrogenase [Betaproteobacteria bacterium]